MELTEEERAALEHLLGPTEHDRSVPLDTLVRAALEAKQRRASSITDGGRIFIAMRRAQLSFEEIADLVGMPESTVRYWIRGVRP